VGEYMAKRSRCPPRNRRSWPRGLAVSEPASEAQLQLWLAGRVVGDSDNGDEYLALPIVPCERHVEPGAGQGVARMNRSVTDYERNWAALAHASTLLTVLVGFLTGGVGSIPLALIPVAIYVAFRAKSRYVAFHALQAVTLQLAGLIIYATGLTILIIGTVIAWAVTGLLAIVLVGVLLIPLAVLVTLVLVLFALLFPLTLLGYALFAAVDTGRGGDIHYRWIGEWLLEMEPSWSPRQSGIR